MRSHAPGVDNGPVLALSGASLWQKILSDLQGDWAPRWSCYLARRAGQKKAREMWFLARLYDAQQALDMGLVNTVVPLERLEEETLVWCTYMLSLIAICSTHPAQSMQSIDAYAYHVERCEHPKHTGTSRGHATSLATLIRPQCYIMLLWRACRCREMLRNSPTALRLLKCALNAADDGHAGIQVTQVVPVAIADLRSVSRTPDACNVMPIAHSRVRSQELGGNATMLFYQSEEGNEVSNIAKTQILLRVTTVAMEDMLFRLQGRSAFMERRPPDFKQFKRLP